MFMKAAEKVYSQHKMILRPLVVAIFLLLIPLFAMLLGAGGWDWKPFDFILMGVLIFGTGFLIELVNKKVKNKN